MLLNRLKATGPHLWFLGFVLPQTWAIFFLKPLDPYAPISFEVYYVAQGIAAFAIAIIFIIKKFDREEHGKTLQIPMALLAGAAPYLALFPIPHYEMFSVLLSAFLGGVAFLWFYAQWFYVYSKLDLLSMANYALLSFALMPILRSPLEMIPLHIAVIVVTPFPLLAVFAQRKALAEIEKRPIVPSITELTSPHGLWVVIGVLAVYGIIMGLFRVNVDTTQTDFTVMLISWTLKIIAPLIFLALIHFSQRKVRISLVSQSALIVILFAIVIATNIRDDSQVTFMIFEVIRQVMYILLFFTLGALAQRVTQHPLAVFGIGWAPYVFALGIGMVIANTLGSFESYSDSFIINVIFLLTASTLVVLGFKEDADLHLFSTGNPEDTPVQDFAEIDRRCELLGEQFDLTKRELETMQLISKGRSKRYIAEHLGLSENTIRGYAKSLYAKLDIHSREELLNLLGIS